MEKTEIQVDRLTLDGDGIGRLENGTQQGMAAFVPYALPGERVLAELLFRRKHHSRWLPLKIVRPSQKRLLPPCGYHFRPGIREPWCGGCNWQQMAPALQRETKSQLVEETLVRLGGFVQPPVLPTVASPADWRYRNKVQVPFGRRKGRLVAGFYAPGSHEIVEFSDCLVQPDLAVQIILAVKKLANDSRWKAYDEDAHRGWLRHLLIRMNREGKALVALVTVDSSFPGKNQFVDAIRSRFPAVIGLHQNIQSAKSHVILGQYWKHLWGAEKITETLGGLRLSYSPGSFFQVNTAAAERLFELTIEALKPSPETVVLDLYCGVGALTLMAGRRAGRAIGVEAVPSAIRDARANAAANDIKNVEFLEGEVEQVLSPTSSLKERLAGRPLAVILDPPRSGCAETVLASVLSLAPARIVYVSCHPATLARDLKRLNAAYHLKSVTPVDLFPQTSHIETISLLEKK